MSLKTNLNRVTSMLGSSRRNVNGGVSQPLELILPFACLIVVWWAAKKIFLLGDDALVSPNQVARTLFQLTKDGILPEYVRLSLKRLFIGVAWAAAIGLPLGVTIGLSKRASRALTGFLRFLQGTSGIAWLPLIIVWFGFTDLTIEVLIAYTAVIPVIFNSVVGVRTVPNSLRDALRTLGARPSRVIRDVYLPGALPSIMLGLRLGIGYGWRALIGGEMIVGGGGIGFLIFSSRQTGQIDRIMAGMIVIGLLFVTMDRLVLRPLEQITVERWALTTR